MINDGSDGHEGIAGNGDRVRRRFVSVSYRVAHNGVV